MSMPIWFFALFSRPRGIPAYSQSLGLSGYHAHAHAHPSRLPVFPYHSSLPSPREGRYLLSVSQSVSLPGYQSLRLPGTTHTRARLPLPSIPLFNLLGDTILALKDGAYAYGSEGFLCQVPSHIKDDCQVGGARCLPARQQLRLLQGDRSMCVCILEDPPYTLYAL
jgi:hypothetical protein